MSGEAQDPRTVTRLVRRLGDGDRRAGDELWPLVYRELHALALRQMANEKAGASLQPTALIHEVWLRFGELDEYRLHERAQFFELAGRIMRSVLVDAARARQAQKRGGGRAAASLSMALGVEDRPAVDVLAIDEALGRLEALDPSLARLVELRFFSGLTHAQCAEILGQSLRTVERNWKLARSWLRAELDTD